MAAEWREHVLRWRELDAPLRAGGAPDANEEYLIYQTLVGAWPIAADRLEAYLEKALREAKRNTSWVEPGPRLGGAGAALRASRCSTTSRSSTTSSRSPRGSPRRASRSALGQLLLKLTAPGRRPTSTRATSSRRLSLVDPDNRRPVDWAARRAALDALRGGAAPTDETMKLFLIWRALDLRGRRPDAFAGAYEPLDAGADVCAYGAAARSSPSCRSGRAGGRGAPGGVAGAGATCSAATSAMSATRPRWPTSSPGSGWRCSSAPEPAARVRRVPGLLHRGRAVRGPRRRARGRRRRGSPRGGRPTSCPGSAGSLGAAQQPGERDLRRRRAVLLGHAAIAGSRPAAGRP